MARFRGTVKGSRGEASRLGNKKSGLLVEADGREIGGQIFMDETGDTDEVTFYVTSGSAGNKHRVYLATAGLEKGNYVIKINPALVADLVRL